MARGGEVSWSGCKVLVSHAEVFGFEIIDRSSPVLILPYIITSLHLLTRRFASHVKLWSPLPAKSMLTPGTK